MKAEHIVLGILAHVDAGKTTLAESILYRTGAVRKLGRVDHQDAFLDTHALERGRGITIFSKQAQFALGEKQITLLDTPGHVDFSAEMERTLQVLDYAVLVISAPDGVQPHTATLWRLLKQYRIPVFLFVNKMDQPGTDRAEVMRALKERLDDACTDMEGTKEQELQEELATCEERLLEKYLAGERIDREDISRLIRERKIFPCYFGSALKVEGVDRFLAVLEQYMEEKEYPDQFAARVFKITREGKERLTWMKIMGGTLSAKQVIEKQSFASAGDGEGPAAVQGGAAKTQEKADQLRIYNGRTFEMVRMAGPGTVCAVTGLTQTKAGEGLGTLFSSSAPVLEPVLSYTLLLPEGVDVHQAWRSLGQLEEEIPELHLRWKEQTASIQVQVMGEVQIEILKELILERLGMQVELGEGSIVYKETIGGIFEGAGHYEPLRHYAEVRLVLSPGERGSGITFDSLLSTDELDINWQRLIASHVEERIHPGVLTGSELTDVRVTLVGGRAHIKHTEGGDFRQATLRAIRQALMKAREAGKCILLEPYYSFRLEVPMQMVGRAMSDIQERGGNFEGPETENGMSVLTGSAPAAGLSSYPLELRGYSGGEGRIGLDLKGYEPCAGQEKVLEERGYDPEADVSEPAGSIFCSHGAGLYVPWEAADAQMHVESGLERFLEMEYPREAAERAAKEARQRQEAYRQGTQRQGYKAAAADIQDDDELMEIFTRTYGPVRKEKEGWKRTRRFDAPEGLHRPRPVEKKEEVLLVDGYNILFAWDELAELAKDNLDGARGKLMDILSNYQGYRKMTLILVFDAYRVSGGARETLKYHNIYVVYTREAETADAYIEQAVHRLAKDCAVTVATSDAAEQAIIFGSGARRMAARELKEEIDRTKEEIREGYLKPSLGGKAYLAEKLPRS